MIDDEFALLRSTFTIILAHSRIDNTDNDNQTVFLVLNTRKYYIVLTATKLNDF